MTTVIEIRFEKEHNRAVAYDGTEHIGECEFAVFGGNWNVYHTGVNPAYGGRGIAGDLVRCVMEQARAEQKKIIPTCSYVRKVFDTRPEYQELLAKD